MSKFGNGGKYIFLKKLGMEEIGDLKSARKLLMAVSLGTLLLFLFRNDIKELNLGIIKFDKTGLKLFEGLPVWLFLVANLYVWIRYLQALIYEPKRARRNIFAYYFIKGSRFESIESISIREINEPGLKNIYLKARDFENGEGRLNISKEIIEIEVGEKEFLMEGVLSNPNIRGRVSKNGNKITIIFTEIRKKEKEVTINEKNEVDLRSPNYVNLSNSSLPNKQVTQKETESDYRTVNIKIYRSDFDYLMNKFLYYLTERHYADYELPIFTGLIAICLLMVRILYINLPK